MTINLVKGGRINLSKELPSLTKVRVGLGWNPNPTNTGSKFDLDVSVFVLKSAPTAPQGMKLISDSHFVFYNNTSDPEKATVHSGDNRDGGAVGDDETVVIELAKLNAEAVELSFVVTIDEAHARKQNFGQVSASYITLYDDVTSAVICTYKLEDDFSTETAVQFGSLIKKDGSWLFKAVGTGYDKGLGDFVVAYGGMLA